MRRWFSLRLLLLLSGCFGAGLSCTDDSSSAGAGSSSDTNGGSTSSSDGGSSGDTSGGHTGTTGTTGTTDTTNGENSTGTAETGSTDSDSDSSESETRSTDSTSEETTGGLKVSECEGWEAEHPEWIFCDDFEAGGPLVAEGRYFEHGGGEGDFELAEGVGVGESRAMQTNFAQGQVEAGNLKLSFGRNPNSYMNTGIRPDEDFREIWYRLYLRNQDGWTGDPAKLSRATVFSSADDWSQAMVAHFWGDKAEHLAIDPVSCVVDGQVVCEGYNDFPNMNWLGQQSGPTALFSTAESGKWRCIEAHVRLDDPGQANGVQEFWIDGELEARGEELEFVGSYGDFAINAVFIENYWNSGSVQAQQRWFDNVVVSTEAIGCL